MNSGFGKTQAQPSVSKRAAARAEAVKRYDTLKAEGIPAFEIYIRIQGNNAWYPVGSTAVKRSDQIDRALFDSQDSVVARRVSSLSGFAKASNSVGVRLSSERV